MPLNSIDLANYNQTLVPCKYCTSKVKRSRLSAHESRSHRDELLRESARRQDVDVRYADTPSIIPERPFCRIIPNDENENWDDSNHATYNPILATAHKEVIRNYCQGQSKKVKRQCREFEIARFAHIKERKQVNTETFQSSTQTESHEVWTYKQINS